MACHKFEKCEKWNEHVNEILDGIYVGVRGEVKSYRMIFVASVSCEILTLDILYSCTQMTYAVLG